jgi:hypothetical protein
MDRFELLESSALMHQSSPAMPHPLTSSRNSDAGSAALTESRSRANGRVDTVVFDLYRLFAYTSQII